MKDRNEYEKAMALADSGQYQEALSCIVEYLRKVPDDPEALNDAGAILHCMGRSGEAVEHLLKAHKFSSENPQILMNLVEVYIASGEASEAESLFEEAQMAGILNPEVLNRTANLFLEQGNKSGAAEVLLRSLDCWPDQEILTHMLTVIKSKRPKIAFFCGADGTTFLDDICDYVRQRFEMHVFTGRTEQELYDLMQWSDISWFEWCTDLAVLGSNGPKVCKTIVRLHRYEAYTDLPTHVKWQNIDLLITVGNSFVTKALLQTIGLATLPVSTVTIPNGVNLERIEFSNRPRGKNIAFVGNLRMVKNPGLLLQCMQALHGIDPEYRLFIAGKFQDSTLEQYMHHMIRELGLTDVVLFDGWQEDMNDWLKDKHYIVSTSIIESQGMGNLEGMASGLKPVIHNFPGASEIYPEEFLFNALDGFCQQILSGQYEPQRYRQFVEQNYSQKQQLARVNELLAGLENEIDSQQHSEVVSAQGGSASMN